MYNQYPPPPWAGYYWPSMAGFTSPTHLDPKSIRRAKRFIERMEKEIEDKNKKAADEKKKKEAEQKKAKNFSTAEIFFIMLFLSPVVGPAYMYLIKMGMSSIVEQMSSMVK